MFVIKANGTRQPYDRKKVIRTCRRLGASRGEANKIAEKVEQQLSDGIETKKILDLIFTELRKLKPSVKYLICLRKGLSLMKSKPDFERFIQILLEENGYEVTPNQVVRGRCIDHEVDAVAKKNGVTYIVEIKHHYRYHTPTGLDESRIARAVFEDVTEGFKLGLNRLNVNKALIICNTKFSEHANRYAKCRGIQKIGWSSPLKHNLQTLIENRKMYPVTCLKGLSSMVREKLSSAGILSIKQLATANPERLSTEINIPVRTLATAIRRAKTVLSE